MGNERKTIMATNTQQPELLELDLSEPEKPVTALATSSDRMMTLVEQVASNPAFDVNKLSLLLDVKERFDKEEARKAFVAAMAAFKANPPRIRKSKEVAFNATKYKYAPLDELCEQIVPALSAVGISHRWETKQEAVQGTKEGQIITVTCILTHSLGHSESTTLFGLPDDSGSKNKIQAIGSAVTYLQRYTLLSATGLAAEGQDNDGGGPKMDTDDLSERLAHFAKCETLQELRSHYESSYAEAKKSKDQSAIDAIVAAKNKRREELHKAGAR
jgi:hypothetical protein